ncbi:hypothetical protein IMSHALPRED_000527 [Imshaugia aleurites]|uniref:Ubiquitin-like protease family profile domain-containing protein n=1 Tax=Imshaugia aleurites TaxID=172621 RepID=A0A8H3IY30_9LECA|nr:hypothetical protein IMSHALPRED_000527 [Imshaugia aleurites]
MSAITLLMDEQSSKGLDEQMNLRLNEVDISAITVLIDGESSNADDESTMYPIRDIDAVTLFDDGKSSKADGEDRVCSTSNISATTPSYDGRSSEAQDQSSTYIWDEMETETNDEVATLTVSKVLIEQSLRNQTEETRLTLVGIAVDTNIDQNARFFAETVAEIIEWWQKYAEVKNPTSHQINFGVGSPINLLMVLALVPERFQGFIGIEDKQRSPFGNGENLSWLHEQTMDVLLGLIMDPVPTPVRFGQGLALMARDDVDEGWRIISGRSWLEDQIHLLFNNELESDLYRFSPETKKIVFFFNPSEIHWTVVEIDLGDNLWTYTLYNSLSQSEKGSTWKASHVQFPLLEQLICRASGFTEPGTREIITGTSVQQENPYDCGPIAVYNAMMLLEGRKPKVDVDTEQMRLTFLRLILGALYLLNEDLEAPEFRARMRKLWLEVIA